MSPAKHRSRFEFVIAGVGLAGLLVAQWILTSAIPGTQYSQGDGKMAQAVIRTALNFGGIFQLNNINPLQGVGSQLQPDNVWLNPAYWPFALIDGPLALDISGLIALGCLALACYLMARCFDVPVLPSLIGAQLSIILFGPLAYMLVFYQVFWINPGIAVVYAPLLLALGIVGRLEPGGIGRFVLTTLGVFALLLYGLSCDPLWVMVVGIGLSGAFAVVVLSPLRIRPILIRAGALACCLALLGISGVLGYVYTLSQYSARVWFSDALAYVPQPFLASIVFISPKTAGSYYGICALGWLLGIMFARGRVRVLILAGVVSFVTFVAYSGTFLLRLKWWLPLPLYIEHSLFPLFTVAAVAGYGAALRAVFLALKTAGGKLASAAPLQQALATPAFSSSFFSALPAWAARLVIAVSIPAAAAIYAVRAGPTAPNFNEPFPNEPELMRYLGEHIGLRVGGEFRGSVTFVPDDDAALYNLWIHGIPTVNEYSQLVTPQVMYFSSASFKRDIVLSDLNRFNPLIGSNGSWDVFFRALQAFGMRYIILRHPLEGQFTQLSSVVLPGRPVDGKPADWVIYELPNPNLGNYSPTEVGTTESGAGIIAAVSDRHFAFTKRVVLAAAIGEPLVPARNMRLSLIRGGLHISGTSDGTSLVVLPQQFSNCLRARDPRIRLVRANLLMTGVLFSGNVDTDIVFDYGIFSPACRRTDLADLRQLDLKINLRMPHLAGGRVFPDWAGAVAKLRAAAIAFGFLSPPPAPAANPSAPPAAAPAAEAPTVTK